MKLIKTFTLAMVLALPLLASKPVIAASDAAQVQALLAKPPAMCGRFEQTKELVGMKKPLLSEGRFCVLAGKGVLWRTLKPFPSTLRLTRDEIVNYQGDRVAMRLDAKTEPTVRMINNVLFSLMAGDITQLEALFEVDAQIDKKHWLVSLTAREVALAKAIGEVQLSGSSYVDRIVMEEASGDITRIVFSAIRTGEAAMTREEVELF